MIFVTPDGERSMNTYLGACVELGPEDVEPAKTDAKVTYFEGYLWDPPRAKEAIRLAAKLTHEAGGEVAMTLSDPFCVDRYREEFLDLMRTGTVDIVFANQHELISLYQTPSFETALEAIRKDCKLAAVTRSAAGSIIISGDRTVSVDAIKVDKVVDTTGAGDLYASGFLYGYTTGMDHAACGRLGSLAAGLVIQQIGPRPRENLREAAEQSGLLKHLEGATRKA
jgi:sugar/nucleoside kinase (ribokinase family)